ncbi:MAG: complex I NDUFA9 subunit family protein [Casimicrobiaceae bacterium]|nr:complex I NDUFA9 subunit family protein [Casimicrobiaceae bacterium]MDW8311200.1 complex I NDUFA9 subunit family protein [Burkholderiales bacterium]
MNVLVLGGSGFVGRALIAKLARDAHRVTVLTRRRDRARELFLLPTVTVLEGNVQEPDTLARHLPGHEAVVFLIGILNERRRGDFDRVHVELVARLIDAMQRARCRRLVHMSALGAAPDAPSAYLRSKAAGEALVRSSGLDWTIFAPSVIFGAGDSFLNRFAALTSLLPPFAPVLLPAADAQFQPVWVDDVARAFAHALARKQTFGQRYELVGPKRYRLRELVAYVMQLRGKRHPIIGLPDLAASALASILQHVPTQPLTPDNLASMRVPSVSDAPFPAFAGVPAALEDIAPSYLAPQSLDDRARPFREHARHER